MADEEVKATPRLSSGYTQDQINEMVVEIFDKQVLERKRKEEEARAIDEVERRGYVALPKRHKLQSLTIQGMGIQAIGVYLGTLLNETLGAFGVTIPAYMDLEAGIGSIFMTAGFVLSVIGALRRKDIQWGVS